MIKNYSESSLDNTEQMNTLNLKPRKETISFLLNFSKSLSIVKGNVIKEIRFDKN